VLEIEDGRKILIVVVHYFRIKLFTVGCEEVLEESLTAVSTELHCWNTYELNKFS